jgi:hypothetical protein
VLLRSYRINPLKEITIAIVCFSLGAFMYIPFSVIVLEPLGFFDKHVSQVLEGPNGCVKITEEWYRYC